MSSPVDTGLVPAGALRPAGTADPARPAMTAALRVGTWVSTTAVAAVITVGLLAPGVWATDPWIPFAVGLLLGVPHGAVDHLVPWWTALRSRSAPRTAALLGGYVALGAAAFIVARLWPVPALLGFLIVSVVHFGAGETATAALRRPRPRRRSPADAVVALAFGSTAVLVPLAAWPAAVGPVLLALAPGIGPLLGVGWAPWALGGVAVADAAALAHLLHTRRAGEAGELLLLSALFWIVPPLVAFAVFFGAWHGLRHLMRLAATDPANTADLARRRFGRPLGRLARHAAPPAAAVLAVLVALWAAPGLADRASAGLVAGGLAVVFALTVPHLVVVALLDRRQLRAS